MTRTSPARIVLLALAALSLAGAGCGSSTIPTTPTGVVTDATIENFAGTLTNGQTVFYSFVVAQPTTVALTFGGFANASDDSVLAVPEQMGLGVPAGAGCGIWTSVTTTPGFVAQLTGSLPAGTYCVSLTDTASLAGNATFAIRIVQGTLALASKTSPETFASRVGPAGNAAQTIVAPTAGTVTATLNSITPSATLGLGLGIWQFEKSACRITQTVTGGPGIQVSAPVDAGIYCVRVFDTGTLADFVGFSVTVVHP